VTRRLPTSGRDRPLLLSDPFAPSLLPIPHCAFPHTGYGGLNNLVPQNADRRAGHAFHHNGSINEHH
jgi:hypothetical protein